MHLSAPEASAATCSTLDLAGTWTCRAVRGPVPEEIRPALSRGISGTVPGVVHLDLLQAGLIPDPYDGDNEGRLAWIGRTDWEYTRTFDWTPGSHERHDLVAEGLDTVARIWLNDQLVGETRNHHRSYRLPVHEYLVDGVNRLRIEFRSALDYAEERESVLGARPHSNLHPFNCIRKPAYSFGWDWGPELVTAGIWRPLRLEGRSAPRMTRLLRRTSWSTERGARLSVDVAIDSVDSALHVEAVVAGARAIVPVVDGVARLELSVPDADPWWPRSHGQQPLYEAAVRLVDLDGHTVDEWRGRLGFRSVVLDTSPDLDGNRFDVVVNGVPVYIRGANWIPADTFLPRVDRDRLASALGDAADANMNLLRVWGGGIYESEEFYDLCDEMGLLVWQDFLLACAAYSEEPELWDEFEAEASEAIERLSAHPSLALLNGGNENIWGWADWGWRGLLSGASWGDGYYSRLFPALTRELADGVPYCEGSPYSFDTYLHPNQDADGSMHIWDVWNTEDYTAYRRYRPRFVSEFGFQGPPAFATLESVVHDEPRSPFGRHMLVHQKAEFGNLKLERGLGDHLPVPRDYVDWHWATQLNQARAIRFGIEHFRSLAPFNTGSVVWQLNDCWPVVSWSAVDGLGRRKPLWFALRGALQDRLCTLQPRAGFLCLSLHNETDEDWATTATVSRRGLDGQQFASEVIKVNVPARGSFLTALGDDVSRSEDSAGELVVADLASGERAYWYFVEDPRLRLADHCWTATAGEVPEGYLVTVEARALVKDLTLLVDHADPAATVDQAMVTLLPGERATFRVSSTTPQLAEQLVAGPVLRTANDLVHCPRSDRLPPTVPPPDYVSRHPIARHLNHESLSR